MSNHRSVTASPVDTRAVSRRRPETIATVATFALAVLLVLASRFVSPALGGWSQASTILMLASFLIVVAFGQGLVILTGGLDLSVPGLITLSAVLTTSWIGQDGGALYLLPAILLLCAGIGGVSGLGVTRLGVPPFIMTMAMGIVIASVALGYTGGTPRGGAPGILVALMKDRWHGVPLLLMFTVVLVIGGAVLQQATSFGRHLYAVGANPRAAYVACVPVNRTIVLVYMVSGSSAGLAGMMLAGYSDGATLRMGDAYLLPSIAAVVVGGSSILGGSGTFIATVGGAVLLTTLSTVIAALGIGQGWRTVIEGLIILLALLLLRENTFTRMRRLFR